MAILRERAAQLINRLYFVSCEFVILVISHFWFRARDFGLITPVPGQTFRFYYSGDRLIQYRKLIVFVPCPEIKI